MIVSIMSQRCSASNRVTNFYIRYRLNISRRSEHYEPINIVELAIRSKVHFVYLKDHMYRAFNTCLMYRALSELEVSSKTKHQASLVSARAVAEEGSHSSRYWLWRVEGRNESVATVKDIEARLMALAYEIRYSELQFCPSFFSLFLYVLFYTNKKQICWEYIFWLSVRSRAP